MAEHTSLPATISAAQVQTGMTLRIHQKIKDVDANGKEKERVQAYEGLVIKIGGKGVGKTMTVRKISDGVGVERIFPLTLPSIQKIELTRMIKARRKNIAFVRDSKKRLKEIKTVQLRTA